MADISLDHHLAEPNTTGLGVLAWIARRQRWPTRSIAVHTNTSCSSPEPSGAT